MSKATKKRGEAVLRDAVAALDQARGTLAHRLDELDLEAMRRRGYRWYGSMQRRFRPRRRMGLTSGQMAAIAGLVAFSAAAVGAGYMLRDRERREQARRRIDSMRWSAARQMRSAAREMQSAAQQRYAELTGGRMRAESDLRRRVEQAIAASGTPPPGLEVMVEGRTVYLRGAVSDPALVDAAAERVHGVPGVVAVVNLTGSSADQQRMRATPQS